MLTAHRGTAEAAGIAWKAAVYEQIEEYRKRQEDALSVAQMCTWAEVNRRGFYRFGEGAKPRPPDMDLREALQRIALEFPCYGWRRMTKELQKRGRLVNH